jgi:hypothetical protein
LGLRLPADATKPVPSLIGRASIARRSIASTVIDFPVVKSAAPAHV